MRAKTGLVLQNLSLQAARDQVRDAYSAATEDFTADQQASLREMIDTPHASDPGAAVCAHA